MSELDIWNEIGNLYYNTGAYDEAIRTYQKVIALNPGCGQSYCNLATIFVCQGRYSEAIPLFQKGIELLDEAINKAFLWNQLGDAYRRLEDSANASIAYHKAIELDPEDATFQENLAEVEMASRIAAPKAETEQENNPYAGSDVQDVLEVISPEEKPADMGETMRSHAANENEAERAPEGLSAQPETTENPEAGIAAWVFKDDEPAAQVEADQSSDVSEPSPVILGSRMLSDAGNKQAEPETPASTDEVETPVQATAEVPDEATSADLEALPQDLPEVDEDARAVARGLLRLGIIHWRNGEQARAGQFLKAALENAGKSHDLFLEALCHDASARVNTDLGKIEEAIQAYQSAANLAPERIFPWNTLGNLNCMLERFEDARAAYQEAIEHNPKDPISWNGMGDVYHKLGRIDDAIAAYQLGNVFEEQNTDLDELKEFEASSVSDLENPQVCIEAGNIYLADEAYAAAVASFRKAGELDASNPAYQAGLAKAEQALQQAINNIEPPAVETIPQPEPEPEPVIFQTVYPEPEKARSIHPDLAWIEKTLDVEAVPHPYPGLPRKIDSPEPEAAYWMFKPVTPQTSARQPAGKYTPSVVNTVVEAAKPAPAFSIHARTAQHFENEAEPSNTLQNRACGFVQMAPRTVQPPRPEKKVGEPITNHEWGSSLPERDAELSDTTPTPLWPKAESPTLQGSMKTKQAAPQPPVDRQAINNDIAGFRKVTELNPKNDRAWDVLGNKYEKIGLHSEAVAAFERAIEICPQKDVYYYHLGIALGYQMQYDKAIQALLRVVEINPDFVLAHCALAGFYRRLGKEDKALEHMRTAQPFMVTENEYNQACFESISGNAERALQLLDIALEREQIQPLMVRSDPDLDFIRKDPRFEALLHKYGIIDQ
jgi:tetratricopeptide (TPR) repeat protein